MLPYHVPSASRQATQLFRLHFEIWLLLLEGSAWPLEGVRLHCAYLKLCDLTKKRKVNFSLYVSLGIYFVQALGV